MSEKQKPAGYPAAIDVRYWLLKRGYSLRELGHEVGVTRSVVSDTISWRRVNRRVALRIAAILGCDVLTLFPRLPKERRNG